MSEESVVVPFARLTRAESDNLFVHILPGAIPAQWIAPYKLPFGICARTLLHALLSPSMSVISVSTYRTLAA